MSVSRTPLTTALLASAIPCGADAAADRLALPERLLICPWGDSKALDGTPVICDATTLAVLSANQAKIGRNEVALDFEHNTYGAIEDGKRVKPKEPVPVAGYGTLSVVDGEGIYYTPLSWTPEGSDYYCGKHYRDLSPNVIRDKDGRVIAVHSVALTRAGQIEGLHAFSADSLDGICKALSAGSHSPIHKPSHNTHAMDYKTILLKVLGLPETATDEEIAAAAEKEAKEDDTSTPDGNDAGDTSGATALSARMDAFERNQLLQGAAAAGKLIPLSAEAVAALPLATLKIMVDGLKPGAVPLSANTAGNAKVETADPKALSAEEKETCRLLGVSEEAFLKHNR